MGRKLANAKRSQCALRDGINRGDEQLWCGSRPLHGCKAGQPLGSYPQRRRSPVIGQTVPGRNADAFHIGCEERRRLARPQGAASLAFRFTADTATPEAGTQTLSPDELREAEHWLRQRPAEVAAYARPLAVRPQADDRVVEVVDTNKIPGNAMDKHLRGMQSTFQDCDVVICAYHAVEIGRAHV